MEDIIGRIAELRVLEDTLQSHEAELVAIYGRRRVGKTYLIRSFYDQKICFETSGVQHFNLRDQLENFRLTLQSKFKKPLDVFPSWLHAFRALMDILEAQPIVEGKYVLFFDEFPWFDTPRSNFLSAFDFFWNQWASRQRNIIVVICGSAASWMLQHIVRNKGGLHNRLTRRIRLLPFSLHETELYLRSRRVTLDRYAIAQLYMALGGIPQYLRDVRPGDSVSYVLEQSCFTKDGWLTDEHKHLYAALFGDESKHIEVIKALANKPSGLTRSELLNAMGIKTGGNATRMMEELEESGFVSRMPQFGQSAKYEVYRLDDEFSHFYFRFMQGSKAISVQTWQGLQDTAQWQVWTGFAFERLCFKHIIQIKQALGISNVQTQTSTWRHIPRSDEDGAQIDLVIDRRDQTINLVEVKFSKDVFTIDKDYATNLRRKRSVFANVTGTRKSLFMTFLTTYGVQVNEHYLSQVQSQLMLDVLFEG
jgi:uncharacterized protein